MRKKHVRNLTAGCAAFMAAAFVFSAGFSKTAFADEADKTTRVYGSTDYTRINPAMDEHCEINVLLLMVLLIMMVIIKLFRVWQRAGSMMRRI